MDSSADRNRQTPGAGAPGLRGGTLGTLVERGQRGRWPSGAVLSGPGAGEPALIAGGRVRVVLVARDGRQAELARLGPGDIVGLAGCFGADLPICVEAVREATLFSFSPELLRDLMEHDPAFSLAIAGQLASRLRTVCRALARLAFASARGRLAAHLLELSAAEGAGGEVRVTQQELADAVGTAREHVARLLGQFRRAGLLTTGRGRIVVRDRAALRRLAGV